MRDMDFSVWTRIGGEPTRMGSLYVTDSEARFSYASAYAQSGTVAAARFTRASRP